MNYLSKTTSFCLIAALGFAPLAFGAVEPWACSVLALLAYTALAALLIRAVAGGEVRKLATPLLIPAVLALILVALQGIRWPAGLLEHVSPRTAALREAATALPGGEGPARSFAPSLYPYATRCALIMLSAYVALFLAAYGHVRSRSEVGKLAAVIVSVGFVVSLLGILQNLSGTHKLYWLRELSQGGAPFGPFVSRNQFAAYAGLCLFVGLGLLLARAAGAAGSLKDWREGLGRKAAGKAHQNALIGFCVAVMGTAVFWSLSRGGILSMLLAFAGVLALVGAASAGRRKGLYVAAVIVMILGWVTYLGWEPVIKRLSTLEDVARDPLSDWRAIMFKDAWRMGLDFPVLGTGAGTFLSVYPLYRTLPTRAVAVSPHDEYVHVFAETGFTGLALLGLAAVLFYVTVIRALARRRNPYVRGLLAGGLGAPLAVMLHSTVDFPMRSPAIAATLAVVAALLCRASHVELIRKQKTSASAESKAVVPAEATDGGGPDAVGARHAPDPGRGRRGRPETPSLPPLMLPSALVGFIVWLVACNFALDPLRGQLDGSLIHRSQRSIPRDPGRALALIEASERSISGGSPGDAELHADLAALAMDAADAASDPVEKLALADRSLKLRMAAARLEPLNAQHSLWLAIQYLNFGRADLAWAWAERACALLPNDPSVRAYLADAFRAHGYAPLAQAYLQQAERIAGERGVAEAKRLIADVRKRLSEATEAK